MFMVVVVFVWLTERNSRMCVSVYTIVLHIHYVCCVWCVVYAYKQVWIKNSIFKFNQSISVWCASVSVVIQMRAFHNDLFGCAFYWGFVFTLSRLTNEIIHTHVHVHMHIFNESIACDAKHFQGKILSHFPAWLFLALSFFRNKFMTFTIKIWDLSFYQILSLFVLLSFVRLKKNTRKHQIKDKMY